MSSIPLYLKIKGSSNTTGDVPHFHQLSETTISFNETDYSFEHVFGDSTNNYSQLIDSNTNSCVLLMGPTASGKTTMLKQLVASKSSTFEGPAFVTAFEISRNKHVVDLLDTSLSEFKHVQNFESTLKRVKFSHDAWKQICKSRATQSTEFNANSSRSCLVVTFYYNNTRTTFIDLMGNEKKGVAANNTFANLNNSAITQLLVNPKNVRSDNLVTNFIFKHQNLKFVLNLDPYGNPSLIKSSLTNVADLVKNFKPPVSNTSTNNTTTTKSIRRVPSYSRPTVSSSRHSPVKNLAKRSRIVSISPEKSTVKRVRLRSNPHSRSLDSNPFIEKNSKIYLKSLAQRSTSTDTVADDFAEKLEQLKNEKQELHDKYVQSIKEIKQDFLGFKQETTGLVNVLGSLESTINQLRQEGEYMNEANKEQVLQLIEEHNSKVENMHQEFESEKTELLRQHECRVSQITLNLTEKSRQEFNEATGKFKDSELKLQDEIKSKCTTITQLETRIQTLVEGLEESKNNSTKTSNELKGQILAKDGQIKELSQKLGQLEQTLYDKEAEYKCQLEKLTEVGSEKQKELDGLVEQCKLEISQLKAERLNADETWKDEQVKLEKSYEKQISEISKSKQELEVDNQALKDKLNDISKESTELIAENEKLKTKSDQVEAVHEGLKNEIEKLVKQLNERDNQHSQLKEKSDKVIQELNERHTEQTRQAEQSIQELKQREIDTKKVLESINMEVEQLTVQLEETAKSKKDQEAIHAAEISRYESQLSQLKEHSESTEAKMQSMKFELESDLAIEKQMRVSDVAKLKFEMEALNEIIESNKMQLNEKEDEIQHLKNLIEEWESKTERLQKKSNEVHSLKERHAGVVAELNDKIKFQKEQINNLEFQLKEQINDPIYTNIDLGIKPTEVNKRVLQPSSSKINTSPSKKSAHHKKRSVSPYKIDRSKCQRFESTDTSAGK